MSTARGPEAVAGCSSDDPIDLVSDEEDEQDIVVQMPVALSTTLPATTMRQTMLPYPTRATARAQAVAELAETCAQSTPARTGICSGSWAHVHPNTSVTVPENPLSSPATESLPQLVIEAIHARRDHSGHRVVTAADLRQTSACLSPAKAIEQNEAVVESQHCAIGGASEIPDMALPEPISTSHSTILDTELTLLTPLWASSSHRLFNGVDQCKGTATAREPLPTSIGGRDGDVSYEENISQLTTRGSTDQLGAQRENRASKWALRDTKFPNTAFDTPDSKNKTTLETPTQEISQMVQESVAATPTVLRRSKRLAQAFKATKTIKTTKTIKAAKIEQKIKKQKRKQRGIGTSHHIKSGSSRPSNHSRSRRSVLPKGPTVIRSSTVDNSVDDLIILPKKHKVLSFWKDKVARELQMGPQLQLISAAVQLFDKRSIKTVVPNRYLRAVRSSERASQTLRFPGSIEMLIDSPIAAVTNAYKEHTTAKLDTSKIVLWTDGSAVQTLHPSRGFAVVWRRSTMNGWGPWEAIGFQARGALPSSDSMEILAVMKAVAKACDLAREMPGQLKAAAIYTDSTSAIEKAQKPKHPLGIHIMRKARTLTRLGVGISLHWVPGHSGVPGNELADKIAVIARKHVYGQHAEFVDLSDDEEEDDWEDVDTPA